MNAMWPLREGMRVTAVTVLKGVGFSQVTKVTEGATPLLQDIVQASGSDVKMERGWKMQSKYHIRVAGIRGLDGEIKRKRHLSQKD